MGGGDHIEVGGGGVGFDLSGVLTAGDDALDMRGTEAPGEGPLRHGNAGGEFSGCDAFDFAEAVVHTLGLPFGADVVVGEGGAGLVFAGEEAGGEGDAGEDAEVEFVGIGEEKLFGGTGEAVVDDLEGFDVVVVGLLDLEGGFDGVGDGVADMEDFSGGFGFFEDGADIFAGEEFIAPGVVLVEVDVIGLEGGEGGFELLLDVRAGAGFIAGEGGGVFVAELGGDEEMVAEVEVFEGLADEAFGGVVAIAFGGIEEVDAEFVGAFEDGSGFFLGVVFGPFAAELPGAEADDAYFEIGFAEDAVFHGAP